MGPYSCMILWPRFCIFLENLLREQLQFILFFPPSTYYSNSTELQSFTLPCWQTGRPFPVLLWTCLWSTFLCTRAPISLGWSARSGTASLKAMYVRVLVDTSTGVLYWSYHWCSSQQETRMPLLAPSSTQNTHKKFNLKKKCLSF